MREEDDRTRDRVQSVGRAAHVMRELARSSRPLSVLQVAERTGLNRSVVHRLIRTLQDESLIEEPESGRYVIGPAALVLGQAYLEHRTVRRLALPYLLELSTTCVRDRPWVVALAVPVSDHAVLVERIWQPDAPLMSILELGAEMSFLGTAHGRCILATRSDRDIVRIIGRAAFKGFRPRLDLIRSRANLDFALDEILPGIGAVAAPVVGEDGVAVASVAISGEGIEDELQVGSEVAQHVLRTARLVSAAFAGSFLSATAGATG